MHRDYGEADEAGIIYHSTDGWTTGVDVPPSSVDVVYDYGAAGATGSEYITANSGWQSLTPIPEPGTMALFALGMLTVAARRRFRK